MADYTADAVSSSVGTVMNTRTGTASADTIPAGCFATWRNTGAGAHVVTLGNAQTVDGLAVAGRTITLAAGQSKAGRINPNWGDANGRVSVAIDGTASEVLYHLLGNI